MALVCVLAQNECAHRINETAVLKYNIVKIILNSPAAQRTQRRRKTGRRWVPGLCLHLQFHGS